MDCAGHGVHSVFSNKFDCPSVKHVECKVTGYEKMIQLNIYSQY